MKNAYTPGLLVTPHAKLLKLRELPLAGRVLVKVGERVNAHTPVLAAELPGELEILRLADRLGLIPSEVAQHLRVKVGNTIARGEVLCETTALFGLFRSCIKSPVDGEVEFFTPVNAHLGIRGKSSALSVNAYVAGVVSAVEEGKSVTVETEGAVVQGIVGVGGERQGELLSLTVADDEIVTRARLLEHGSGLRGKILVGGKCFDSAALTAAADAGVAGVVTGAIDSNTLHAFAGGDVNVAVTGDESLPFTLIVTEGFGALPISRRVVELCREQNGKLASMNGATQVRAGAMRPELIVPTEGGAAPQLEAQLQVGSRIRCLRPPHFGALGEVTQLPANPEEIATGARVRVLRVRLDSGKEVTVPRANAELV
jgi:hypothetical protein